MPYTGRFCNYRKYLPRACGDVPISIDPAYKEQGFTPRLRGCTQFAVDHLQGHPIYPAPAGMYPTIPITMASSIYLPRACGDVPQPRLCAVELHTFTPRLRGCTFWRSVAPIFRGIYPAPAGIYPLRSTSVSMACDLPRACGDVPSSFFFACTQG